MTTTMEHFDRAKMLVEYVWWDIEDIRPVQYDADAILWGKESAIINTQKIISLMEKLLRNELKAIQKSYWWADSCRYNHLLSYLNYEKSLLETATK